MVILSLWRLNRYSKELVSTECLIRCLREGSFMGEMMELCFIFINILYLINQTNILGHLKLKEILLSHKIVIACRKVWVWEVLAFYLLSHFSYLWISANSDRKILNYRRNDWEIFADFFSRDKKKSNSLIVLGPNKYNWTHTYKELDSPS